MSKTRLRTASNFALALLTLTSSWASASPRIHNYAMEFSAFWESTQTSPIEAQVARFKSEFAPKFPAFYRYKFENWKRNDQNIDTEIAAQLREFAPIATQFARKSLDFETEMKKNLKSFSDAFPDFDSNIDIYVTHSMGEMDGGTRLIGGKLYFIFGVEGMVKYHNSSTGTPFFHHELFHVYHDQHFRGPDRIWTSLWREGLATYISWRLNPSASFRDIMLDIPSGLVERCDVRIDELWRELTLRLDSESEDDYRTLFLFASKHPWIPKRAGYYLGFLIARELGKSTPLADLIRLQGPELRSSIEHAIEGLSLSRQKLLPE